MLSLFDNKYYKTAQNPQKLVIFIHGYNGSPESIDYAVQALSVHLPQAVVVVPRAPFACEKNGDNLQWLSFYKVDPEAQFRNQATSTQDIFEIFNQLGDDFAKTAAQMNDFIDEQQKRFGISDTQTYVMGFSQGAMIALYTALTRQQKLGGCVMVAGIVAGKDRLAQEMVSRPRLLLLHGKEDQTVQYKTVPETLLWLKSQQIGFEFAEFESLAHRMNELEMAKAAEFIGGDKAALTL